MSACVPLDAVPLTARDELFLGYHRLAYRLANRWAARWRLDQDDTEQVALQALWAAAQDFQNDRGSSFAHFAAVVIEHRLTRFLQRERRGAVFVPWPRTETWELDVADHRGQEQPADDREEVEKLLRVLPARSATVVRLYFGLDGRKHSLAEISKKLGVTKQVVHCLLARALKRLRAAAEREKAAG
jgi:RNA polymerase sigma factor (sigma-70 family)